MERQGQAEPPRDGPHSGDGTAERTSSRIARAVSDPADSPFGKTRWQRTGTAALRTSPGVTWPRPSRSASACEVPFEADPGRYDYGPVLSTSLAVLTLAIPDETVPIFQR